QRPIARRTGAPLQIAGPRYVQLPTQPCHWVGVAMSLDPGVPHRDSFAKSAAAFFTISRSSLVLASSRRKRLFSASNSAGEPFMGVAADTTSNFPLRLRRIQFPRLDAGIPSRWAAWLMPTDSANRNASCLYSSVYLRFGAVSLAIALSVHQNIIKILMYVETGQGHLSHTAARGAAPDARFFPVESRSSRPRKLAQRSAAALDAAPVGSSDPPALECPACAARLAAWECPRGAPPSAGIRLPAVWLESSASIVSDGL